MKVNYKMNEDKVVFAKQLQLLVIAEEEFNYLRVASTFSGKLHSLKTAHVTICL